MKRLQLVVCIFLISLITGCGGGNGNSSGNNSGNNSGTTVPGNTNATIIGSSSQSACENAANSDSSACFVIQPNSTQALMYGVIGSSTPGVVKQLIAHTPKITEILMVNVPGSEDDESNIPASLAVHKAGINTKVNSNSNIASGGVDFFLAGIKRVVETGAKIGVHSWSNGSIDGASLPENDPQHLLFTNYYRAINLPDPVGFYWFTLKAAPSSSIHYMTAAEISRYNIATPVKQRVIAEQQYVHVGLSNQIAKHEVIIESTSTNYITGDNNNNIFYPGSGVNHIDGGHGTDTIVFEGSASEYQIINNGSETIVYDSFYERNGITLLEGLEKLVFEADKNQKQ